MRRSSRRRSEVALPLGDELLGHVGMRLHPAAAAQRPGDQGDDAAVLHLEGFRIGGALGRPPDAFAGIAFGIAGEDARLGAAGEQFAHRHAAAQLLAPQIVHLDEAHVAQNEPAGGIVHAQRLRHVVERDPRQEIAPTLLREGKQRAASHKGERQHQREADAGRDRHGVEGVENSVEAVKAEKDHAERKTGKPATENHAPLAKVLCKSVTADHRYAPDRCRKLRTNTLFWG